jgi:hypothetical protein
MGGWSDLGTKRDFGHPSVLYFKANEKHKIRLLSDELPAQVFYHSCRDESGGFIKVRCIGSRNGCRFCEANNAEQYIKVANSDRPYPFRSEYVGPVWVYELNQVKLLVGKQNWEKGIKPLGESYGTLANRDLEVLRQDVGGQVSYTVIPLDVSQFLIQVDFSTAPKPDEYIKWLDANAAKVIMAKLGGPAAPASPAPGTGQPLGPTQPHPQAPAPGQPLAPTPAQPTMAPPPAQPAPQGQDDERKALQAELSTVMARKFDSKVVEKLLAKHGQGKQIDEMNPDQLRAMITDYKLEFQLQ